MEATSSSFLEVYSQVRPDALSVHPNQHRTPQWGGSALDMAMPSPRVEAGLASVRPSAARGKPQAALKHPSMGQENSGIKELQKNPQGLTLGKD